jgi:hypothetical protein
MIDLLDALWNRSGALLAMQLDIENGDFEDAMQAQFDYLYWSDEFIRLFPEHGVAYTDLVGIVWGK